MEIPKRTMRRYRPDLKLVASYGVVRGEMVDVKSMLGGYVVLHLRGDERRSVMHDEGVVVATQYASALARKLVERRAKEGSR